MHQFGELAMGDSQEAPGEVELPHWSQANAYVLHPRVQILVLHLTSSWRLQRSPPISVRKHCEHDKCSFRARFESPYGDLQGLVRSSPVEVPTTPSHPARPSNMEIP